MEGEGWVALCRRNCLFKEGQDIAGRRTMSLSALPYASSSRPTLLSLARSMNTGGTGGSSRSTFSCGVLEPEVDLELTGVERVGVKDCGRGSYTAATRLPMRTPCQAKLQIGITRHG